MRKIVVTLFFVLYSFQAFSITRAQLLSQVLGMTNDQIWSIATSRDANGWTGFGKCWVFTAKPTACPWCFCTYYSKATVVSGYDGYPDVGTGCMYSPPTGDNICWGDWASRGFCTADTKQNYRNMLVEALNVSSRDVCDLAGYTTYLASLQPPTLNVSDSSKLLFVRPEESQGKVLCGTADLAQAVNGVKRFIKITAGDFCAQALAVIEKKVSTVRTKNASYAGGAKYITLPQYNQMSITSQQLLNLQTVESNYKWLWYGSNSTTLVLPYIDMGPPQYSALTDGDIALWEEAVGLDKLPTVIKTRFATVPAAIKGRAPAGLAKLKLVPPQPGCSFSDVINYVQNGSWPAQCN